MPPQRVCGPLSTALWKQIHEVTIWVARSGDQRGGKRLEFPRTAQHFAAHQISAYTPNLHPRWLDGAWEARLHVLRVA